MEKNLHAKVLLVDDEDDFLKTLTQRLEMRGQKVTGTTHGEEAKEWTGHELK
jgi:DNA-binding response OmpR family regulator